MISLKARSKRAYIEDVKNRTSKIPMVLDETDYERHLNRTVGVLDKEIYEPRSLILQNALSGLIDVTHLDIDVITNVYYSPSSPEGLLGGLDIGVGILPIISANMSPFTVFESMVDYLAIKQVLNMLQRQMLNTEDYVLLPVTAEGKQFLEVRNQGNLLWIEFLPYLDPERESWLLYEFEHQVVGDLFYYNCMLANYEIQSSATSLGSSKEAVSLYNIYEKKITETIKSFTDGRTINYGP